MYLLITVQQTKRSQGDQILVERRQLRHSGGARPVGFGLPVGFRVLLVREAGCVRRRYTSLRRQGGHQHLPGRLRAEREHALQRNEPHFQGFLAFYLKRVNNARYDINLK